MTPPAAKASPTATTDEGEGEPSVVAGAVATGEIELAMLQPTITVNTGDSWNVVVAVDWAVVLADPEKVSQYTRAVLLLEAIPFAATIDEWAEMHDAAVIVERSETLVGSVDAIVYDIS